MKNPQTVEECTAESGACLEAINKATKGRFTPPIVLNTIVNIVAAFASARRDEMPEAYKRLTARHLRECADVLEGKRDGFTEFQYAGRKDDEN